MRVTPLSKDMAQFEPTPVGHLEIDDDHQVLARLLSDFAEALSTGVSREEIARRSCDLFEYLRGHFRREEDLMALYHYPQRDQHRRQHMLVAAQIARWFYRIQQGVSGFCLEDVQFLEWWLNNHIVHDDRALADFIRQCEAETLYQARAV